MSKLKEQDNSIYFVEVKEPNEVRRHILETLKDIVEVLHRFERFKSTRQQKIENIQKLRVMIKDANKMLGTLKTKLPQTSLKAVADEPKQIKKIHHKKLKKVTAKQAEVQKRGMTETEKLEAELSMIEGKLKSLA